VVETLAALKAELARLLVVMADARNRGNEALADLLADHAAELLAKIAGMGVQSERPAVQQQQQVQPDKREPETKE
jgi:hypothetical protein